MDPTGLTLAEAFADVGVGRKLWRQLRAELRLEEESFDLLLDAWRLDSSKAERALRNVLSSVAADVMVDRLISAADVSAIVAVATDRDEDVRDSAASLADLLVTGTEQSPCAGADVVAPPGRRTLADVWASLPRLCPGGGGSNTEGHQERRRALRWRLQLQLSPATVEALTNASKALHDQGPPFANLYIERVWVQIANRKDAVDMMVALISSQADVAVQRALRTALRGWSTRVAPPLPDPRPDSPASPLFSSPWAPPSAGVRRNNRWQRSAAEASASATEASSSSDADLCLLPDPQLAQVLSFCASASCLCELAAASRALCAAARSDELWARAWRATFGGAFFGVSVPSEGLRARLLARQASRCVECGSPTEFEHGILGCRLCEECERCCPRYAMIRSAMAMQEYQLPERVLIALPHLDGLTGRVYLRSAVEGLAEDHHSREGLQQLRAKFSVGQSAAGRQRKSAQQPKGRSSAQSAARGLRGRKGIGVDDDPCCFEATALRRANEIELGG
mmetsp:Transcript_107127/g.341926  ORF Transcript_107127/g.341926 Transcript_107127/m.341926 type:complete len:511 (-) Transcript_107127:52-1584(-)